MFCAQMPQIDTAQARNLYVARNQSKQGNAAMLIMRVMQVMQGAYWFAMTLEEILIYTAVITSS